MLAALNYFGSRGAEVSEAGLYPYEAPSTTAGAAAAAVAAGAAAAAAAAGGDRQAGIAYGDSDIACDGTPGTVHGRGLAHPTPSRTVSIGASPDGLVRWPASQLPPSSTTANARGSDMRVEPLEVKCHAPFRAAGGGKGASRSIVFHDLGPSDGVAVWSVSAVASASGAGVIRWLQYGAPMVVRRSAGFAICGKVPVP